LAASAVRRSRGTQPEPALGGLAGFPHPVELVPGLHSAAVLAGQRRSDMDVIRGVPDRDPPHPGIVAVGRQPGPVHDPGRDLTPLRIGQHPVPWGGPDRAMPDRLIATTQGVEGHRLGEQPGQPTQIP
jgi:hypothetical protein